MEYVLVAAAVLGAVAYLAWRTRRYFVRPSGGSCCGGCPVGAPRQPRS